MHGGTSSGALEPTAAPTLVAQHLPPLSKFSGGQGDNETETFEEWLEQLEMVAVACQWSEQAKLVNLTTRLKGQAYAFLRTCTPAQKASYTLLVERLRARFTPVNIPSVQTSLFHDRKQRAGESVDEYAQDLQQLFLKAYPRVQQGSSEAEQLGKSVLASQFVAGLRGNIKLKLAGSDGDFDHLLTRARFEEAKDRDLGDHARKPPNKRKLLEAESPGSNSMHQGRGHVRPSASKSSGQCFSCGATGHFQRQCPMRGRGLPREARGSKDKVATIVLHKDSPQVAVTEDEWQDRAVDRALEETCVTLHGVEPPTKTDPGDNLGTIPTTEVHIEGVPAKALVDTGSPTTIISLPFLLEVLSKNRTRGQDLQQWRDEVKERLQQTSLHLRSYSGQVLPIVKQVKLKLSREHYHTDAWVQVQANAPVQLLLGTDLQPALGVQLMVVGTNGDAHDLLNPSRSALQATQKIDPLAMDVLPFPAEEEQPSVCLLQAVKLPPRQMKLVRVRHCGKVDTMSEALFQPDAGFLNMTGLDMEDAMVSLRGEVTLVVSNPQNVPVRLEEGQLLGQVQPVDWVRETDGDGTSTCADGGKPEGHSIVCGLQQCSSDQRQEQLIAALDLDGLHLNADARQKLEGVIREFADTFALTDDELGNTHVITHTIDTGSSPPIRQPPRRIPFSLRGKVEEMIAAMLKKGVVQPSSSPWASPIVLVAKKDGSTRFCVDYRRLNAVTKMDVYPLPRIDDSLDLLAGNKYFTTLDLASGYWQVRVEESDREKTAFTTHNGLYEFVVMPFGLCNAPATFQRLMENILHGLVGKICLVYIDDILVMGTTLEEHLENLRTVLTRLHQSGLRLKPSKCHLLQQEVEYLGHRVSAAGVMTDPSKAEAVRVFPVPTDVKPLRSFLGLASYYRRFIPNFSVVASPLFQLTKKGAVFQWDQACQKAFDELKRLLIDAPVLAFSDFSLEFILETDASGIGLGAVLAQEHPDGTTHPIAYASRTVQPHERNYGITELEALAVVWSVKHFRQYLYGHKCHIFTDHEALKALLNTPHPSGKLARWGLLLQELDLTIHYVPGKKNPRADALSRSPLSVPDSSTYLPVVAATAVDSEHAQGGDCTSAELRDRQRDDPQLRKMIELLEQGILPPDPAEARLLATTSDQYVVSEGILYHLGRDKTLHLVPPTMDRKKLYLEAHGGRFGAHLGDVKVHEMLARHYWWPKMRNDITSWTRSCLTCATRRVSQAVKPLLSPIPVSGPFDRVGVDVVQLPMSARGNRYAVVFMDYLTKWPEVYATRDQSAYTIAKLLVEGVITRHGVPSVLLSDRGSAFLSKLLKEVYELMGIKKANTTAYHPQTDGLVEQFHCTLLDMLAKTGKQSGKDLDTCLPFVLFAYRASQQASTGESPFYLLYGRDPRLPTEAMLCPVPNPTLMYTDDYITEMTKKMTRAWELARDSIQKAQARQKIQHDRHARPLTFQEGERVCVYASCSFWQGIQVVQAILWPVSHNSSV